MTTVIRFKRKNWGQGGRGNNQDNSRADLGENQNEGLRHSQESPSLLSASMLVTFKFVVKDQEMKSILISFKVLVMDSDWPSLSYELTSKINHCR